MYPDLLPALHCPRCRHAPLRLSGGQSADDGEILAGHLECAACGARFPVRHGIPDLLGRWDIPATPAQLVNALPLTAWGYERLWRYRALSLFTGERFGYGRELHLIARLTAPERPGLYVDLACSAGLYARALQRARGAAPGHVVGIDHSYAFCAEARRMARQEGLRISFVRGRAQSLPLAPGSVAGVVVGGSLNEIGDLDACLAEVRRVLPASGRFVAMSLARARGGLARRLQALSTVGGLQFWDAPELTLRLRTHGLRVTAQWRYGIVLFSQACVEQPNEETAGH